LNERADECAELGYTSDHDILCPGPDKYGSLWLRTRPNVLDLAKDQRQQLQSDRAQNKRILEKVIASNNLRAVKLQSTIFAKDILSCRAQNKRILEKEIAANNLRAVKLQSTIFAKDVLQRDEGETILRIVSTCAMQNIERG
jgi:hypothetical protein